MKKITPSNILLITSFIFCLSSRAQTPTVRQVDSILFLATQKLEAKKYNYANELGQLLLSFDSIVKTQFADVKMAYHYKYNYDAYVENEANFICGESLVFLHEYDSALIYLKKVTLSENVAGIRAFNSGIEVKTKIALLMALCYEKLGQTQQAIDELLPLLFIDAEMDYSSKNYSHSQVLKKMNELNAMKIILDTNCIFIDTSVYEYGIYGYVGFMPPIYYKFKNVKMYILPKTEMSAAFNKSVKRNEALKIEESEEHPLLSEFEIKTHLDKQQLVKLLLQFDYFKE